MNDFIDIYCERLGPGFWAEPLNALSNISFFIAAFFVWTLAKKYSMDHRGTRILVILLLAIGTGSTLFHTIATKWAMLTDTLPILFYQIEFIALYSVHVMRLSPKKTMGVLATFFVTIYVFNLVPESVLNGSVSYVPALLFLSGFAAWHNKNAAREKTGLLLAAGTFLVSLSLRSLDMQLCPEIPFGVHFLWHILNGILLYLTARAYILNARLAA
jgi:hypothetical protein